MNLSKWQEIIERSLQVEKDQTQVTTTAGQKTAEERSTEEKER